MIQINQDVHFEKKIEQFERNIHNPKKLFPSLIDEAVFNELEVIQAKTAPPQADKIVHIRR